MARKNIAKLTARDGKSIITHLYNLNSTTIYDKDEPNTISKMVIENCNDTLLLEALNQITTLECSIIDNQLITNYSRYLWKLKAAKSIRQYYCRLINPIGLIFFIRNTNNPLIYKFKNFGQCHSLRMKLPMLNISEYGWYLSPDLWDLIIKPEFSRYIKCDEYQTYDKLMQLCGSV